MGLSAILGQLIGLAVLVILAAVYAPGPGIALALLPVLLLFQAIFTLGLAWIVAGLNVFYRDTVHLVAVLLLVWMYGTPIFYPAAMVPERHRRMYPLFRTCSLCRPFSIRSADF